MNPIISIIIPVYKVEEYLDDCVQSVVNQTYKNLEIILVDDGSPDKCPQLCDEWAQKDSRIRVIHKPNGGLSSARNAGLDTVTGDYVSFVDSDDELPYNAIELMSEPLKQMSVDMLIGKYKVVGKKRVLPLCLKDGTYMIKDQILSCYAMEKWDATACNKIYRYNFLKSNNLRFKEGLIHEDILWSFQIACLAHSLYVVNKETYIYKIRDNSIVTSELDSAKIATYILVFSEICRFASDHEIMCDSNVHTIVEDLRKDIIQMGKGNYAIEKNIYMALRALANKSWGVCLQLNGLNLRKNFRDIHFALSPLFGFLYVHYLNRILCCLRQCYRACIYPIIRT